MDERIEAIFRSREEFQLEVDPVLKRQLHDKLLAEVEVFLETTGTRMSAHDFVAATTDIYRNWRRNPH